jgi:hypothetical protein
MVLGIEMVIDLSNYRKDFREYLASIEDTNTRLSETKNVARQIERKPDLYSEEDIDWARQVLRNC